MRASIARLFFGLTAALVATGLAAQAISLAGKSAETSHFKTASGRIVNMFFYFTIESNLLCGVTCLLLAISLNRPSTRFSVFRLAGVVGVTITGVVYHAVLRQLYELNGLDKFADFILHTVVPVMGLLGWLLFGPRGIASLRVSGLTVLYPLAFFAVTLVRGPMVHWYPYPFVDVMVHGYAKVAVNAAIVAALVVAVCAILSFLDVRLGAAE